MYSRNYASHDHLKGMCGVGESSFVTTMVYKCTIEICVCDSTALGCIQVLLLCHAKVNMAPLTPQNSLFPTLGGSTAEIPELGSVAGPNSIPS